MFASFSGDPFFISMKMTNKRTQSQGNACDVGECEVVPAATSKASDAHDTWVFCPSGSHAHAHAHAHEYAHARGFPI